MKAMLRSTNLSLILLWLNFCPSPCLAADGKRSNPMTLIASGDEVQRRRGKALFIEARDRHLRQLLSIVSAPVTVGEEFWNSSTRRNISMALLADLRASEAVPALMKWLVPRQGQSLTLDELSALTPASCALVKIGLPALDPLLACVTVNGTSPKGEAALRTIAAMLGGDAADWRLERAIASQADERGKANLRKALKALRSGSVPVIDRRRL